MGVVVNGCGGVCICGHGGVHECGRLEKKNLTEKSWNI